MGGCGDRGQGDPGVGDGTHRRSVAHVIPDEKAIPAMGLGARGKLGERVRVDKRVERGDEDSAPGGHPVCTLPPRTALWVPTQSVIGGAAASSTPAAASRSQVAVTFSASR